MPRPIGSSPLYNLHPRFDVVFTVPGVQQKDANGRLKYAPSGSPMWEPGTGEDVTIECHAERLSSAGSGSRESRTGAEDREVRVTLRAVNPKVFPAGTKARTRARMAMTGVDGDLEILPTVNEKFPKLADKFGHQLEAVWRARGG